MIAAYVVTNILVAGAWLIFAGLEGRVAKRIAQRAQLGLGRVMLGVALVAAALTAALPSPRPYDAAAALWPRPAVSGFAGSQSKPLPAAPATPPFRAGPVETKHLPWIWTLLGCAALVRLGFLTRDAWRLRRVMRGTHVWRRQGRLDVRVSDTVTVPFSMHGLRRAHIVIPSSMLHAPQDLRLALRHEGQHHRHGDGLWTIGMEALTLLLPLNPAAALWRRSLTHLQEFACDEALIGRKRVDPQAYGHCLIRVTEAALARSPKLVGTASMAAEGKNPGHTQRLLTRRIRMLNRYLENGAGARAPRRLVLALGVAASALTMTAAYAAQGIRPRDPMTREQVQELVDRMDVTPDFHIVVDDLVVERINAVITDPEKCAKTRAAFERMDAVKARISNAIDRYDQPIELLAVPLVESMYKNLPQGDQPYYAAGMWQIIPSTARNYGLVVTDTLDQRRDVDLSTDAALRLLGADHLRFQDWLLALAAYNQGETIVQNAISQSGTRDAWRLIHEGRLNNYVTLVTAGAILIANPQLVD